MGQYWWITNMDKRQGTGDIGKMGEFFFYESPVAVLYLLAVPAIPPEDVKPDLRYKEFVAGSWAGDRIICLGDYARDWPAGLVTADDFEPLEGKDAYDRDGREIEEGSPRHFISRCVSFRGIVGNHSSTAYPSDRVWVLRNLTKKIYVRSDRIPAAPTRDSNVLEYGLNYALDAFPGLACVFMSHIGWSSDTTAAMCYEGDQTRGQWAGDRLDARIFDHVKGDMAREGWEDVSRREAERLYNIWVEDLHFGLVAPLPDEPKEYEIRDLL